MPQFESHLDSPITSLDELLDRASHDFTVMQLSRDVSYLKPQNPAFVVYCCGNASEAPHIESIDRSLVMGLTLDWGETIVSRMPRYVLKQPLGDDRDVELVDLRSGAQVNGDAIRAAMGELSRPEYVRDARQYLLYFIVDTVGMAGEDFERYYQSLAVIQEVLQGKTLLSMVVAVLDQTPGSGNARTIAERISRLSLSDDACGERVHRLHDSLLCLSNMRVDGFRNGLLDRGGSNSDTAQGIFPDIVLVSNTSYASVNSVREALYDRSVPAFTVAFSSQSKPLREIMLTILQETMRVIAKDVDGNVTSIDSKRLREVFGITGSTDKAFPLLQQVLKDAVAPSIRSFEGFECLLPRSSSDVCIEEMSFKDADRASFGCLSAFVKERIIPEFENRLGQGTLENAKAALCARVKDACSSSELRNSDLLSMRKDAAAAISAGMSSWLHSVGQQSIRRAVEERLKQRAIDALCDVASAALSHLHGAADETVGIFNRLNDTIGDRLAASVCPEGIRQFYGTEIVAKGLLADERQRDGLAHRLLRIESSESDMLAILYRDVLLAAKDMTFKGEKVFALDLMDELAQRLTYASSTRQAEDVVARALNENVRDAMWFETYATVSSPVLKAFLLHGDGEQGSAKLWEKLSEADDQAQRALLNTRNTDSATALWFYPLDDECLQRCC